MSEALGNNFEGLLREALAPVEPPEDLALRLESTLESITEMAADELQEWELSAMRDPRNWAATGGGARGRRRRGGRAGAAACSPAGAWLIVGGSQRRTRERRAHRARSPPRDTQAARRPLTETDDS